VFLYFLWRNLRDSYEEEKIVSFGWLSLLLFVIGSRLAYGLLNWGKFDSIGGWFQLTSIPGMIYEGGILAVILISWWYAKVNNWKIWSFFEDITSLLYIFLTFFYLDEWWQSGQEVRLLVTGLTLLFGHVLANYYSGRYRSFSWYKSGKKGFVFGMTNLVVSLLFLGEAFLFKDSWPILVTFSILCLIFAVQLVMLGELWKKS